MPNLKNYQWRKIAEWFCPSPGYVLDFSNQTFKEFFEDHFQINIYADAFSDLGTSKFNRLMAFLKLSPPHIAIELLNLLWSKRNYERDDRIESVERAANSEYSTATDDLLLQQLSSDAEVEDKR